MEDAGLDSKVVIIGPTDVGKTSLTLRYVNNTFVTPTSATIGASFLQKKVLVGDGEGEGPPKKLNLQIWDTAGQERFRSMAPMYYRQAKAAILVFDVSQEQSFAKIKEWLHDLQQHVDDDIVLALVGNKIDCPNKVDPNAAENFARQIGAKYFTTSAKTGDNVLDLFESVAMQLYKQNKRKSDSKSATPPNNAKSNQRLSLASNGAGEARASRGDLSDEDNVLFIRDSGFTRARNKCC